MKKLLFILSILFLTISVSAQKHQPPHPQRNWEKIDELRLEFVLKKLSLSQSHQAKFIPIYKVYQRDVRELFIQRRKAREENKNNPEAQVNSDFAFESKLLELRTQYKNKFQGILTAEEVNTLYSAEREFKEQLLKQLKK